MSPGLVTSKAALEVLRNRIEQKWAEAICADYGVARPAIFSVPLRPGLSSGKAVERANGGSWHEWRTTWRNFELRTISKFAGVGIILEPVTIRGVTYDLPATLVAENVGAAVELISRAEEKPQAVDLGRARSLAKSLDTAGVTPTPATLKATYRLTDADTEILFTAIAWLSAHPDVSAWTARQLPVPGMHSKWLETHGGLLQTVTGRDVRAEVRPRLAVVHLTYVDPDYTASGKRRHDAWTTGDTHDLAYTPRVVLIVENRDCRLWFPHVQNTVVVEGNGKAAASLLAEITWIRTAEHVVYWGDIDADGYAILDRLRATMAVPTSDGLPAKTVHSILMEATDLHHHANHGVNRDKAGCPIKPSSTRLVHLTSAESTAYDAVATAGPAQFRRIEQEVIPLAQAAARLEALINTHG
ncbi:Wadjet anti-phage system protein JetD domain-containing protein [Nocardia carnea]|uniref:Wadjet anti-phage system protein JetD domain-containing protein n=1 Tax=Nocardia carnea TaxID=37328 RepID=UPI002455DCE8|nr:Wadjet anti-phage system protein JetD domain-containing protein [Nocardia carnea]